MEMSWNLDLLRQHITNHKQADQGLLDLVNSLARGVDIFRYHFEEARDSLADFYGSDTKAVGESFKRLIGIADDQQEYYLALLVHEANVLAAIYTVRSLFDQYSQLVRGLLLDGEVSEQWCNIYVVRDRLEEGEFKENIEGLLRSGEFQYVNAFANVSKHRFLVKQRSRIDLENNKSGVCISSFEYRGDNYPELWSKELLELILKAKNGLIFVGCSLNGVCPP